MTTAVDTNVLLDLLIPNARFLDTSRKALERASAEGSLILCETVYAELASQFDAGEEVRAFLSDTHIQLVPGTPESLFLASRAWNAYRVNRKAGQTCPACGHLQPAPVCAVCGEAVRTRQHLLSDFLIGAHATLLADGLLTRDRGFYAACFEGLNLFPLNTPKSP